MAKTFTLINDDRLIEIISTAKQHVIYASPSISYFVAEAIVQKCCSNAGIRHRIVLDVDAEPMRLGFGDADGLRILWDNNIEVRDAPGLRIGVLVVDEDAWVFAPTPEIILKQPDGMLSNAVKVNTDFALEMIPAIAPHIAKELDTLGATIILESETKLPDPEIGRTVLVEENLKAVEKAISESPPVKFDSERKLRVYKGLFQFVEFHFNGGRVTSHTITIPPQILNIAEEDSDLRRRIRSTCRLVDEKNEFATKLSDFSKKVEKLRKDYTTPLGKRYGSVILRRIRQEFDGKIEKAMEEISELTKNIEAELQKAIDENRRKLIDLLLPALKDNLPANVRSRTLFPMTDQDVRDYIGEELDRVIPRADQLIKRMELNLDYKDITYEMLTDVGFKDLVKKKFRFNIDDLHTEELVAGKRVG